MNNLKNILDLSRTSIIIAVIIFITTVYISKYIIQLYTTDSESESESESERFDWKSVIHPILIGVMCSFGYLALFKYVTNDNCDILTDPFCSKLNIV
jgi:hypothetical protein